MRTIFGFVFGYHWASKPRLVRNVIEARQEAVYFVVSRNPSLGPAGEKTKWPERLLALKDVWTTLALFIGKTRF